MSTEAEDQNGLFSAFVLSLVVVALPVKNLAYIAPPLYVFVRWLQRDDRLVYRLIALVALLAAVSSIAVLVDHLAGLDISLPAMAMAFITYASLLVVLCHDRNIQIDGPTYQNFVRVSCWFIIVQSLIGFVQFAATRNPDAVCGTFGLLDGWTGGITIAQVYFTFTLFCLMLFVLTSPHSTLAGVAIFLGVTACVLAQSGHQSLFFLLAFAGCSVIRITHIRAWAGAVAVCAALAGLTVFVYPASVDLAQRWYAKTVVDDDDSLKIRALENASDIMDSPKNLLLGTGLGQFSSRAALIASNTYLNVELPDAASGKSHYFKRYVEPLVLRFDEVGEGSAISKPYLSGTSLPVELGAPLFIALLIAIGVAVRRNVKRIWSDDRNVARIGRLCLTGLIFFCLCCFVENYAEFSQAIFLPFVAFAAAESRAHTITTNQSFI